MITIPEGDITMDYGYSMGTYDSLRVLQQGLIFTKEMYEFVSEPTQENNTVMSRVGVGIRMIPEYRLDISDVTDSSMDIIGDRSDIILKNDDRWILSSDESGDFNIASPLSTIFTTNGSQIGVNTVVSDESDIQFNIAEICKWWVIQPSIGTLSNEPVDNMNLLTDVATFRPLIDSEGNSFISNSLLPFQLKSISWY